jgi:hypothetical protein
MRHKFPLFFCNFVRFGRRLHAGDKMVDYIHYLV